MSEPGLICNFTGDGKGKTSAALGIVLRALGWEWRVAVLQFMKSDQETGELRFFRRHFPNLRIEEFGLGRTVYPGDHAGHARAGWRVAAELLKSFDGELLVLDELNVALAHNFLDAAEVIDALKHRRPELNVVITGRNAPRELCAVCDLVSSVEEKKHPFRSGIPARKGLDY